MAAGTISTRVLTDIANAIRQQNGGQALYKPSQMAAAILALTWDTGLKARALLLTDGTLEFNYRNGRSSDVGAITQVWEVSTSGYSSDSARPWHSIRAQVKRVVFDSDWSGAGMTNYGYWRTGMNRMTEVRGFEQCSGATDVT